MGPPWTTIPLCSWAANHAAPPSDSPVGRGHAHERRKRYESADELIEALRHRPAALRAGVLRSLKGAHVAFTGILSKPRREAARAARRAGATVYGAPSAKTTVVVRGRPNPRQAAGRDSGLKLMEIKRLREKGHRITLLNEEQFWRLVHRR